MSPLPVELSNTPSRGTPVVENWLGKTQRLDGKSRGRPAKWALQSGNLE